MDQKQLEDIVRAVMGQMSAPAANCGSVAAPAAVVDGGSLPDLGGEQFQKTWIGVQNPKNKEEAQLYNQQKAEAFATALNEINKANGVSQRFSSNDIRKEMPLLVRYTKGDKMITAAVKLGSQEARVAFDAAKNAYKKKNTTNTTQSEFGSQSSGSGGDEGEFNGY